MLPRRARAFGRPQRALAFALRGDRLDVQGRAEVLPSVFEASSRDAAPSAESAAAANVSNELSSSPSPSPKDQVGERGEAGEVQEFDDEVEPGAITEGAEEDTKDTEAGPMETEDGEKDIGEDEREDKVGGDKLSDEVEDGAIDDEKDNGVEGNAEAEEGQKDHEEDTSKAEKEEDDEGEVVVVNPKVEEEGKTKGAGAAAAAAAGGDAGHGDRGDGNGEVARAGSGSGNGGKVLNGKGSEAPIKSVLALPPPLEKRGLSDIEFYKKEMGILRMANGLIAEVRLRRQRAAML